MKDIKQAATSLGERLGHPPWLTSIGVGSKDGHPAIVVLLAFPPKTEVPVLDQGFWEGYPIDCRLFGSYAPLGRS
jgi:hypothetical protein